LTSQFGALVGSSRWQSIDNDGKNHHSDNSNSWVITWLYQQLSTFDDISMFYWYILNLCIYRVYLYIYIIYIYNYIIHVIIW
jgi:hypothetical protein